MRIELEGAAQLRRTLKAAGVGIAELKSVNRDAASVVASAAKASAPVGPAEGGHIRSTIRVGATAKAGVVRVGNKAKPYGGPIHWGWPARHIHENPWVADAAQATEPAWVALYMKRINEMLSLVEGI